MCSEEALAAEDAGLDLMFDSVHLRPDIEAIAALIEWGRDQPQAAGPNGAWHWACLCPP
jgi:hypothetical protein